MSFFSSDSAYDGDIFTPTLTGGGVELHGADEFSIDVHVDLTLSVFGGEVPLVAGAHLLLGASWQP